MDGSRADGPTTVQNSGGGVGGSARRWLFVGGTGVFCGGLLAWLFWALTGATLLALVIGAATASILLVLAVAGSRYNANYHVTADRRAEVLAKRERVRRAIEDTHRQG